MNEMGFEGINLNSYVTFVNVYIWVYKEKEIITK